jgi:hypothetical protein
MPRHHAGDVLLRPRLERGLNCRPVSRSRKSYAVAASSHGNSAVSYMTQRLGSAGGGPLLAVHAIPVR